MSGLATTLRFVRRAAAGGSSTFDNDPGHLTTLADWSNESAAEDGEWAFDSGSNPAPTGGNTTRVTSGYAGTPALGGAAVLHHVHPAGALGGYGTGRLQRAISGGPSEVFIAAEVQFASDYPTSNNPGGGKILLLYMGTERYFLNLDIGGGATGGAGNWNVWQQSTLLEAGTQPMVPGVWQKLEWYHKRDTGSANGIMRLWVGGVLALERTNLTTPASAFSNFYVEMTNNGNYTAAHPSAGGQRYIGYDAGAEDVEARSWTSRLLLRAA